jgi:parallel beta-helix repeat protein
MTFRNCNVSDTSTEGIYILSSSDVLLEKNIFTRNNIEKITGYYPAAVKIFNQCYRVTCNDNLVIDFPYSNGIWYDVGNVDGVFTNNWVEGVGNYKGEFSIEQPWPSDNGFFFEISKGTICAGNVFVNCDHGIWILNSSNALIFNNTFINSTACIARNARSAAGDHFGWHPSTGPDVDKRDGHVFVNNLLYGDSEFNRLLLYVWQPSSLCDRVNNSQLKEIDYNFFVKENGAREYPVILWSPYKNDNCRIMLDSPQELNKLYPAFLKNSKFYDNYLSPLFKGYQVGNYQLLQSFPDSFNASKLPQNISKYLSIKTKPYIGAYEPIR